MSLRHITHFPFMAKKVVLINLQATPDDEKADLRIWAKCDPVFIGLMERLGLEIDPIPVWRPKDSVPIEKIPSWVNKYYVEKAKNLEEVAKLREVEAEERRIEDLSTKIKNIKVNDLAVEVGNTHVKTQIGDPTDKNTHQWTVFVRSPPSLLKDGIQIDDIVDSVEYKLHPTFSPSVVRVGKAPFEVRRIGWGTFDVSVKVNFKSNLSKTPLKCKHELNFSQPESSQIVTFNQVLAN